MSYSATFDFTRTSYPFTAGAIQSETQTHTPGATARQFSVLLLSPLLTGLLLSLNMLDSYWGSDVRGYPQDVFISTPYMVEWENLAWMCLREAWKCQGSGLDIPINPPRLYFQVKYQYISKGEPCIDLLCPSLQNQRKRQVWKGLSRSSSLALYSTQDHSCLQLPGQMFV